MHILDTVMWKWDMKRLPDLNVARSCHSSTSLGDAVYVACGEGDYGRLNSVERLWMGTSDAVELQAWGLIDIHQLSPSMNPVFSQINRDELCILGGRDS